MRINKVFSFQNVPLDHLFGHFLRFFKFLFFSISLFFSTINVSHAQQIAGGELAYACKGIDIIKQTTYEVSLTIYAKCPFPSFAKDYKLDYKSNSLNQVFDPVKLTWDGSEVVIKACENGLSRCDVPTSIDENTESIVKRVYKGTVKLPKQLPDWILEVTTSQRTSDLNAVAGAPANMYLQATINNTNNVCNVSSSFENLPPFFFSEGQFFTYNPLIKNPDGDKVVASIISPRTPTSDLSYIAPYSYKQPFATTQPIVFNIASGKLEYTPSKQGDKSVMAFQLKDYRNGVEIGSVMREIYVQTLAKKESPPYFSPDIKDTYTFCQGTTSVLTLDALSDVKDAKIDITIAGLSTSDYSVTKSNQKSTLRINVNTTSPGSKFVTVKLIDSKCAITTKFFYIKVVAKPVITTKTLDTSVLCRRSFNLSVNTIGGGAPYKYLWSNGKTTKTISAFDLGTYSVVVSDTNNCTATWNGLIKSNVNFTLKESRCVDSAITFIDISKILRVTKWNWTFENVNGSSIGTFPSPDSIFSFKFPKSGTYKVKMEISDDTGCSNSVTKNINIYDKPVIDFAATDTCQKTEDSDLKVLHTLTPRIPLDTTIALDSIKYFLNGMYVTHATGAPTRLKADTSGNYKVKLSAKNDAGCVTEIVKTIHVRERPTYEFFPLNPKYFYRCDSPVSIDTVFKFQVKAVDELASFPMKLTVVRTGAYKDSLVEKYMSLDSIIVPYHIVQNAVNGITIKMKDSLGCTNDTAVVIQDPITPDLSLTKHYCFLNDTLKVKDAATYHWGLDSLRWDLKDGTYDTTRGYVNHAYTTLDEAKIALYVRDKMNCIDTTEKYSKIRVFLSEPDTNQFTLSKTEACNIKDTVIVTGIKNKYINSWYYRLNDKPELIFSNASDKNTAWIPNRALGRSIPDVDTIIANRSNKYTATTAIIYNDTDSVAVRVTDKKDIKGCLYIVKRNWQVLDTLHFTIDQGYNHCKDSIKLFKAKLNLPKAGLTLDTASWKWTLTSPTNVLLDQKSAIVGQDLTYNPATSYFSDIATTRPLYVAKYPSYQVKVKYEYYSENRTTCIDSTILKVANEEVFFKFEDTIPTCAQYRIGFPLKEQNEFFSFSTDSSIWDYGNGTKESFSGATGKSLYPNPSTKPYNVTLTAINEFGCRYTDSTKIVVKPSPVAILDVNSVCAGTANRLDGSKPHPHDAGNTYYWYLGYDQIPKASDPNLPDTTQATLVTSDSVLNLFLEQEKTKVFLAVKNSVGCFSYTDSAKTAKVNPVPHASFDAITVNEQDRDYLGNEPIAFDDQSPNVDTSTTTWDMGNGDKFVSNSISSGYDIVYTYPYFAPPYPPEKNKYTIMLKTKTNHGCVDSTSKSIDLNTYFVLPSAFSPNEDGLHDFLLGIGKGIKEIKEFKIFNRWGEEVQSITGTPKKDFEKRGYLLWDGKYKGEPQPVGSYVYYVVVKTGNGDELIYKGNLALVK